VSTPPPPPPPPPPPLLLLLLLLLLLALFRRGMRWPWTLRRRPRGGKPLRGLALEVVAIKSRAVPQIAVTRPRIADHAARLGAPEVPPADRHYIHIEESSRHDNPPGVTATTA